MSVFSQNGIRGLCALLLCCGAAFGGEPEDATLKFLARSRVEDPEGSGEFSITYDTIAWDPAKTAIIICDMWDTMCCKIVADRVAELAPRMNEVVSEARRRGVLIVHCPSNTMDYYKDTPQRQRCLDAPEVATDVELKWNKLDSTREAPLPIDDSDGGWEGPVTPGPAPQTHQHDAIHIAPEDAIGDSSDVIYLLYERGIENVILMGVHTNMCVLGRPFGIRQLTYLGKNVALMRDMTDGLYNPEQPPHVSHFRGTELVVEHIEKYWCPTITSTDLLGRPAFRFAGDKRPHVAFIVSDDHYGADKTLPRFAQYLRESHRMHCTVLHGQGEPDIPQVAELSAADAAVLFVRRLGLPAGRLKALQDYVNAGKPLVALRTASHAFTMNLNDPPGFRVPEGRAEWREFDHDVLGGSYSGHGANKLGTDVRIVPEMATHPILRGIPEAEWHSTGSLYFVSPMAEDATVLMTGAIPDREEPLTWVRERNGRMVYSGLGHPDDFGQPQFVRLLTNAIYWAMDREAP